MTDDSLASVLSTLSGNPNIRKTLKAKSISLERVTKGQDGGVDESGIEKGGPWLRAEDI